MAIGKDNTDAIEIAKKNSPNEILIYGKGTAYPVKELSDVPEDWKSVIPYSEEGRETRRCFEIVNGESEIKKDILKNDLEVLIKVKEETKISIIDNEIKPETRPDPKPKELNWHETKSGRPMKTLRFVL
jgi:hypothetical protein